MEARARLFGHPIHQMLIPIPLGLFTTAAVIDIVNAFVGSETLGLVSFWNLTIGIAAGLLAAVFGLVDWTKIPRRTRAKRIGLFHAGANVVAIALFAFAVVIRSDEPALAVTPAALVAEIGALLISAAAGWLGGELVDRLAIGVDPDAHPDHDPRARRVRERPAPLGTPGPSRV